MLRKLATRTGPGWEAGAIAVGGRVDLGNGRRLVHQLERPVGHLLDADLTEVARFISALGHPARLRIVTAVLRGANTLADLQELPGMGTSGQVNHHLRELRSAGLIESRKRNHYTVTTARVVPILIMITAALGPDADNTGDDAEGGL